VYAGEDRLGSGVGNSKQMAQQLAAREALAYLDELGQSNGATP
jgi:dsRNA-specific ribonuclease